MSVIFSKCMECSHLYEEKLNSDFCCDAFPNGIPKEALWEQDEKKECSNGYKFEKEH